MAINVRIHPLHPDGSQRVGSAAAWNTHTYRRARRSPDPGAGGEGAIAAARPGATGIPSARPACARSSACASCCPSAAAGRWSPTQPPGAEGVRHRQGGAVERDLPFGGRADALPRQDPRRRSSPATAGLIAGAWRYCTRACPVHVHPCTPGRLRNRPGRAASMRRPRPPLIDNRPMPEAVVASIQ